MGSWRGKVTKKSDCFRWLKKLKENNIIRFRFGLLPEELKNKSMLHRAVASGLLTYIDISCNGVKTWELNLFEISKLEENELE